ncbi:uncharacterized protein LOC127808129 [Diospyros lotus]|uniref:uncharacterized protein LOC127808129 n=1 Tax=Diospyros lotus TaxID=55363 RepID=UPI002252D07B|nr:uncharacterized protein LOC127808129 [Diospyros lotus]
MAIDDSFKKPGAIPFKWEIRPGVPKHQHQQQQQQPVSASSNLRRSSAAHQRSSPTAPTKLSPPPAGLRFRPPQPELWTRPFHSSPRTRSERYRLDRSLLVRREAVAAGCFPSPLAKRKGEKNGARVPVPVPRPEFGAEPEYASDLETPSRWSLSTRKSVSPSPFRDSPLSSSSFSSYRSSPHPVSEAEWAGFALF